MRIPKPNRQLYKLHQAYGKHELEPLASGNCFHYCKGCGCWFDTTPREPGLTTLLRRRMFMGAQPKGYRGYSVQAVVQTLDGVPRANMRSFGRFLKHIGYGKPGSSTAKFGRWVTAAMRFRG